MSKIKNGGLDQYGSESFEQQQFGTAGVERVNATIENMGSVVVHCVVLVGCRRFSLEIKLGLRTERQTTCYSHFDDDNFNIANTAR